MKIRVCRASEWDESKDPKIPGAYQEDDSWYVDISSMEDLMNLLKKLHENCVVYPGEIDERGDEIEPCIQIYDDYIE